MRKLVLSSFLLLFVFSCAPVKQQTPTDALDWFNRAEARLKEHKFEAAEFGYRQVVDNFPESRVADEALFKLGYTQVILNEYDDAIVSFSKLEELYPDSHWLFDARLWRRILEERRDCLASLENVRKRLRLSGNRKDISEEVRLLKEENERLKARVKELEKLLGDLEK
ncbi:tetratricopeptide repeat protein [bacterium]|nr:tetratricopeptide repeat protein [bacterium]